MTFRLLTYTFCFYIFWCPNVYILLSLCLYHQLFNVGSFLPFLLLPLCPPVTWPRTHLFVTVIWNGWLTTCAPTQLRPVVPAAPARADWQTNALDRLRARNSAAPVGWWLIVTVPKCLFLISLSGSLSLRVALLFLFHLSLTSIFLPSLFLSAGSGFYLCIVPSNS